MIPILFEADSRLRLRHDHQSEFGFLHLRPIPLGRCLIHAGVLLKIGEAYTTAGCPSEAAHWMLTSGIIGDQPPMRRLAHAWLLTARASPSTSPRPRSTSSRRGTAALSEPRATSPDTAPPLAGCRYSTTGWVLDSPPSLLQLWGRDAVKNRSRLCRTRTVKWRNLRFVPSPLVASMLHDSTALRTRSSGRQAIISPRHGQVLLTLVFCHTLSYSDPLPSETASHPSSDWRCAPLAERLGLGMRVGTHAHWTGLLFRRVLE